MVYKATKLIAQKLDEENLSYEIQETENDNSIVRLGGFDVTNGPTVHPLFISSDDDPDVSIRIFSVVHVSDEKRGKVLEAVNNINNQYRYVKFVLDGDGDVNVEYDVPVEINIDNVGDIAYEILVRTLQILDKAYPVLMQALWA